MMISIWHLLWIVPVSTFLGVLVAALVSVGGGDQQMITEDEMEMFIDGIWEPRYAPSPPHYDEESGNE